MERTMKLQDVISKAMAKKLSWLEAAEIAGVTGRTMRRIRERYQEFGYTGLFDQRRGKRSIHRIPMHQRGGSAAVRRAQTGRPYREFTVSGNHRHSSVFWARHDDLTT
jgi:hypothetical protein